jgi:hypothetical protein
LSRACVVFAHPCYEDYDKQLQTLGNDISNTQNVEMESEDFVKFTMNFTEKLKYKWWSISFDERWGVNKFYLTANFM